MKETKKKYFQISSLEKGIRVMEILGQQSELTVSQTARLLGINRSASHRFLATLRELGYVEQNAESRYQLTFKVFELGMKVVNRFQVHRLAPPYLRELAATYNETVNLGHWDGREIIHVDKIDSREILRMDPGIGTRAPAYCTGLGKSILAFMPKEKLLGYLDSVTLEAHTPNTITSRERLEYELRGIREKGFAVDNEELSEWLRCVASPIFDNKEFPTYAISISGPVTRMTDELIERMASDVKRVCAQLSARMGKPDVKGPQG